MQKLSKPSKNCDSSSALHPNTGLLYFRPEPPVTRSVVCKVGIPTLMIFLIEFRSLELLQENPSHFPRNIIYNSKGNEEKLP